MLAHVYVTKNNKYNIYSTVVDEFIFEKGITLEELKSWMREEFGNRQMPYFIEHVLPTVKDTSVNSQINVPEGLTYDEYITRAIGENDE